MTIPARTFVAKPAVRESVPLLVGLTGPSGGGKTFSALRLATGMQEVIGGEIFGIDTEARRMLHYADRFKFQHVKFDAPFGSLDYLNAIRTCVEAGGRIIIVDSMSHEHESPGGLLDLHERELERLAGNDYEKRERVKMLAWQKPKAHRRLLINGLLQLTANFIFCFRAKETVRPMKVGGKTQIVPQGFLPIAGEEFVFEMTINCLLLPGAGGVPTWQSDEPGERRMIKPAEQFKELFAERKPLDESIGRALAQWARGEVKAPPLSVPAADLPASVDGATTADAGLTVEAMAREAAIRGEAIFNTFYKGRSDADKRKLQAIGPELRQLMEQAKEATAASE